MCVCLCAGRWHRGFKIFIHLPFLGEKMTTFSTPARLHSASPLPLCWLLAHWQRHGRPNTEINGNKSIQRTLLTFVGDSQWCLWHQAAGIMIGMWHYTIQKGKMHNYELVPHKMAKSVLLSQSVWLPARPANECLSSHVVTSRLPR